jgi:hypothetical protein
MTPPFHRPVLLHSWGDTREEAEGLENKAVGCIAYPFDRQFGVFNGVREVPDLDGNLVEDVVVQVEVDAEESPLERVTRRSRSLRRALVLGMIADCEVLIIVQTVSPKVRICVGYKF